ncbi:MAG: hypothetical protein ABIH83_04260 [Candidatus Micrarchaeota archaeon]
MTIIIGIPEKDTRGRPKKYLHYDTRWKGLNIVNRSLLTEDSCPSEKTLKTIVENDEKEARKNKNPNSMSETQETIIQKFYKKHVIEKDGRIKVASKRELEKEDGPLLNSITRSFKDYPFFVAKLKIAYCRLKNLDYSNIGLTKKGFEPYIGHTNPNPGPLEENIMKEINTKKLSTQEIVKKYLEIIKKEEYTKKDAIYFPEKEEIEKECPGLYYQIKKEFPSLRDFEFFLIFEEGHLEGYLYDKILEILYKEKTDFFEEKLMKKEGLMKVFQKC